MKHVRSYAELRRDRQSEILSQLSNLADFFGSVCFLHPARTRFTIELINVFMNAVVTAEMRMKHALASPRPVEYSPKVMPMIQTPGHSCYPSGHATEGFMLAHLLTELLEAAKPDRVYAPADWRGQLRLLAARIAVNRIVAGVHFPVDNAAGVVLGSQLARYFVELAKGSASLLRSWTFDARYYRAEDFPWRQILVPLDTPVSPEDGLMQLVATDEAEPYLKNGATFEVQPIPGSPVRWLWDRAVAEWKKLAVS